MICPNTNSPEWKALTSKVTENEAYYLWNKYEGDVPSSAIKQVSNVEDLTPAKTAMVKLDNVLQQVLSEIGVSYQATNQILDDNGKPINVVAKADMINKVLQMVEGKADVTTLPEETSHFLVESLDKKGHVYQSMYNAITKYDMYFKVKQEYEGKFDYTEDSIRKEAMARLLGQEIINASEQTTLSEPQERVVKNWWNMLLSKIKQMFSGFNKEKFNDALNEFAPYRDLANKILKQDLTDFRSPIQPTHSYYQVSNSNSTPNTLQLDIKAKIEDAVKGIVRQDFNGDRAYAKDNNRLGDSVTTKRDKLFDSRLRTNTKENPDFIAKRDVAASVGNRVHDDMDNLSKIHLTQDSSVQKVVKTSNAINARLEKYILELRKGYEKEFKEPCLYLAEQVLYDANTNTPGTADLIVITPTGRIDIYDWKTMSISKREKEEFGEPLKVKTDKYEWQLNAYKKILQSYGLKSFGKIRYIPIETQIVKNKNTGKFEFKGFDIGSADPSKNTSKTYLNPVPVSEEKTEIEGFDKLLDQMKALYKDIYNKKVSSTVERQKKAQRLKAVRMAIRDLQLSRSLNSFVKSGNTELANIEGRLLSKINPPAEDELADMIEHLSIYKDLTKNFSRLYRDGIISDAKQKSALQKLEFDANEVLANVEDKMGDLLKDAASAANVNPDLLTAPQKPIGIMSKLTTALSRIDHPMFRTLWNLINKSKEQSIKDMKALNIEINAKLEALKIWGSSKGLTGTKIFDIMLDRAKGKLISKYNSEYYKARNAKRDEGNWEWVKNNSEIDKEALDKYLKEQRSFIETNTFSTDKAENKRIKEFKLQDLKDNYDLINSNQAYLNSDPFIVRFIKPSKTWLSKEYKYLLSPENKPALEFYELFTSKMREFNEFMPFGREGDWVNPERFIPNIKANIIETTLNAGGSPSIKGMGKQFSDMFDVSYEDDRALGELNEFTGEYQRKVPAFYLGEGVASEKSYDLGMSLALFSQMAYNYKHMTEIEGTVRNLRTALEHSRELALDGSGKVLQNAFSNKVVNKMISADTLSTFDDFVNYYMYGIKTKDNWGYFTKTKTVVDPVTGESKIEETKISKNKIASKILKFFSVKALGLNLPSALVNMVGGALNSFYIAGGKNFFTKKQWAKSMALISQGNFNPKVMGLLEALDIHAEKNLYKSINNLSVHKLANQMNYEKIFFLHAAGDKLVYNITAISLAQNFGLDTNGKIMRMDKLPAGSKSLLDALEVGEDGKLNLTTLIKDENEFIKFKTKIQALGEKMIGMSSRDNVSAYRLTMAGQALMQFRGWIPRTVGTRFGSVRFDPELGVVEKGRYLSLFQQVFNRRALPCIKELITGVAAGTFGENTKEAVRLMYTKFLEENPNVDPNEFTEDMFYEMHTSNLKASAIELIMIAALGIFTFSLAGGWEDDEKQRARLKRERKRQIMLSNRLMNELAFYISPSAGQQVIKGGVPILGLLTDYERLAKSIGKESFGDDKTRKKNYLLWDIYRTMPTGSTMWNYFGPTPEDN